MKPHLFTTSSRQRRRLRDYVIDLNREKNFDRIVSHFCVKFRQAARAGQPFPALVLAVHGPAELKRIMATNLRRLSIDFENSPADAIGGHSDDWVWPWDVPGWWWDFAFGDDDGGGEGEGEGEGEYGPDSINKEERDQLEEVMKELDG
jgi:hypothetical protein